MKKIVAILLAILMLMPVAHADGENMTLRLSGASGKIGDTVTVTVSVENAPACASFQMVITYDSDALEISGPGKKLDVGGLFYLNPNTTQGDQKAIKATSAGIGKAALEGDMDLFSVDFKIIGKPADALASTVSVYSQTFSANDKNLTPIDSIIIPPCRITVVEEGQIEPPNPGNDTPADGGEEEVPPISDRPVSNDAPVTNTPDAQPSTPGDDDNALSGDAEIAPAPNAPTGDWFFQGEDVLHHFYTGEDTLYKGEYEKDEEGKITGVTLYDEKKNELGSLKVEEDAEGNLTVLEQDLQTDKNDKDDGKDKGGFSPWFLLPMGAAVLIAIAGIILYTKKK
ncbi:MAG: hypothetical protein IJN34_02780 [Clostridia bacterium]|nr:hypothetical protein [Clostridia bacterium]